VLSFNETATLLSIIWGIIHEPKEYSKVVIF